MGLFWRLVMSDLLTCFICCFFACRLLYDIFYFLGLKLESKRDNNTKGTTYGGDKLQNVTRHTRCDCKNAERKTQGNDSAESNRYAHNTVIHFNGGGATQKLRLFRNPFFPLFRLLGKKANGKLSAPINPLANVARKDIQHETNKNNGNPPIRLVYVLKKLVHKIKWRM